MLCIALKSNQTFLSFSISKMLRTPVLGKGRKVKHHYKAFRTVLSMMVEFNLARQVLGVKHISKKTIKNSSKSNNRSLYVNPGYIGTSIKIMSW